MLSRIRDTPSQTSLGIDARALNVRGAFAVDAARCPGIHHMAIVDDVMSAGSSLRATRAALAMCDAIPVVVGALLVLGSTGADHFAAIGMPVVSAERADFDCWTPTECPLCRDGTPLEDVAIGHGGSAASRVVS